MISIPIIVLHKITLDLGRKLVIGAVLCMSLLMIAMALLRGISAAVLGIKNPAWIIFWIQLEASVSILAACPIAFRSLFLALRSPKPEPDPRSVLERLRKRTKGRLPTISVGTTLTGSRAAIRGDEDIELASQEDGDDALPSYPSHTLNYTQSVGTTHEPV